MARIRTVKPEFWLNEDLALLPPETRLLAIGLLNHSDDEGYFKATPQIIKAAIFPFDEDSKNIPRMLQELSSAGYLRLGSAQDGKRYGHVVNFLKHQRVDKAKRSEIKDILNFDEQSKNNPRTIQEPSMQERKGKEREMEEERKGSGGAAAPLLSQSFSEFWDQWPPGFGDKGSRKNAEAVWLKLKPDKDLFTTIMRALSAQFMDKQQRGATGQFCPPFKHVERWLRNREWENEIQPQRTVRPSNEDRTESVLNETFGDPRSEEGVFEGSFQRIDPHEITR